MCLTLTSFLKHDYGIGVSCHWLRCFLRQCVADETSMRIKLVYKIKHIWQAVSCHMLYLLAYVIEKLNFAIL